MQDNIDKDLSQQFSNWNPMRDAYHDSKFNKYTSGPGAELEDSLQPSEIAKQTSKCYDPYLVFKNVPTNLTLQGLLNICSAFGSVSRGRRYGANMYFIDFASINDMERVFTELQNNTYGFKVYLGNKMKNDRSHMKSSSTSTSVNAAPYSAGKIDYDRSYYISPKNHPRPQFPKQHNVSKLDYDVPNSLLNLIDPQRHFLIEEDAYDLERLTYSTKPPVQDGKYNYHSGRSYYAMSQRDKLFIQEKQRVSAGAYDPKSGEFSKTSPAMERVKLGPCNSCNKVCDLMCARCLTYFCSIECQRKEWQTHRHICGKPPGLLSVHDNNQSSNQHHAEQPFDQREGNETNSSHPDSKHHAALEAQLPKSGSNVIITAISKTNVVFVRSMAYNDNLNFFNTVHTIQRKAQFQRAVQHTPERGSIVLTKFKEGQYNRAMILNADDLDHIKLIYIDYGNIDVKSLDELLDAPEELWKLPRIALPIVLKDVPDFFMTDEVKKYMFTRLNTEVRIIYAKEETENGVHKAELFDLVDNESFNKTIASFRAGSSDENKGPILYRQFLEQLPLPEGENVQLIIMDNSLLQTSFISCSTKTYAQAIQKFQDDIQQYANANNKNLPYTPRVNELCIAKYSEDGLWYRGRCIELVGDGHPTILFFDFGNLSIVSVNDIQKYPEEFTFPVMTVDCEINGLPDDITDNLKSKLEVTLPLGAEIVCDKVEKSTDGSFYTIYLGDLLAKVLP